MDGAEASDLCPPVRSETSDAVLQVRQFEKKHLVKSSIIAHFPNRNLAKMSAKGFNKSGPVSMKSLIQTPSNATLHRKQYGFLPVT